MSCCGCGVLELAHSKRKYNNYVLLCLLLHIIYMSLPSSDFWWEILAVNSSFQLNRNKLRLNIRSVDDGWWWNMSLALRATSVTLTLRPQPVLFTLGFFFVINVT